MKKTLLLFTIILIQTSVILAQESSCENDNCHKGISEHEFEHPAMEDGCLTCHDQTESDHPKRAGTEFELTDEMPDLCYSCHDAPEENLNIHPALESGDCTTCHNPHGSDFETILRDENPGNLCFECHDVDEEKDIIKHGPVISRQCVACHDPHASSLSTLLREEPPELCFMCHVDKKDKLEMTTVHAAYEGSCTDCHTPHNAHVKYLLKDNLPNLCFECHDDKSEEMDSSLVVHKALNEKKSCVSCHNPHATNSESLLIQTGSDLCFECHDRTYKSKDRKIKNIKNIVVNATTPHPPVADGECISCHNPHYSQNYFLLNGAFPFGAYAEKPSSKYFQLCFDCHDSDKLDKEYGTEFTEFRKGNKNLHFFHISKNKGRNCTTCHEVHGSNKSHLIANKVLFGKWKMPLNYKETENGGSCMPGCHQKFEYNREK